MGSLHVRCADVDDPNCRWEARGDNEADIMRQVEQHGREAHGRFHLDNQARDRVRSVIHGKKAA